MTNKDDQTAVCIPTGTELYDAIMGEIEPELTSSQLPLLAAKYENESHEERKERLQRFNFAFTLYQRCYDEYLIELKKNANACKDTARTLSDKETALEQHHAEQNLLDAIDSL